MADQPKPPGPPPEPFPFDDDAKTQLTDLPGTVFAPERPLPMAPVELTPEVEPSASLVRQSRPSIRIELRRQYALVVTSSSTVDQEDTRTFFGEPAYSLWQLAWQMFRIWRVIRRMRRLGVESHNR